MLFTWKYLLILSIAYIAYLAVKPAWRIQFLTVLSLAIICFWSPASFFLVTVCTFLTFLGAKSKSRVLQNGLILAHVGGFFLFKTKLFWTGDVITFNLSLLGYSYYALQNISFLKKQPLTYSFWEVMFSNAFFPKFIAGPIRQNKEFPLKPTLSYSPSENLYYGINRILYGIAKKVILADRLGTYTNNLFNTPDEQTSFITLILGSLIFTLQMYLDFSAYSDIAIGGARIFGFTLGENFNLPLRAKSISEYWRKTHITLINWLTNEVFYPLVYNWRKNIVKGTLLATLITFTVSGLWHGTSAGFLIWGMLNAIYLMAEYLNRKYIHINNKLLGWPSTILLIVCSNFFFKLQSFDLIQHKIKIGFNQFFPSDWQVDLFAIMSDGGHLLQQYNVIETFLLLILFLVFEKSWQKNAFQKHLSILYLIIIGFLIIFFGNFNAGEEFIYVQF